MEVARIPVSTTNLGIGMYVAKLDRPWLETPFVFQGFEIKDRFEIEQLQTYCSQVYVDIERGSLTEAQVRALAAGGVSRTVKTTSAESGRSAPAWLASVAAKLGLDGLFAARHRPLEETYRITATVRAEAAQARQAYERAAGRYRDIFERTRRVGAVDVEAVHKALRPALESILRNPDAMAWTVFSGKRSTRRYCRAAATAVWALIFGRYLGFDRNSLEKLAAGAYLLDIGNVTLPDELLASEGAMPLEDYDKVVKHVEAGVDILRRSRDIEPEVFEMLSCHHERFDGSGYPAGLQGGQIPAYGRIAAIADCYDAMTTRNAYSPAMAGYDAARELNDARGKLFHTEVVEQFLHAVGMFPTGSIVELNDGRVGLVLEQNRLNPLQPKVLLLKLPSGKDILPMRVMKPEDWPSGDRARRLWVARGHEHGAFGIDPAVYFTNRTTPSTNTTGRGKRFVAPWARFRRSR